MRQTYTPSNLIMLDGMVAAVIGNGSAFVHTAHGDEIYVPGRQVDAIKAEVGDGVRCWCMPNDPEHSNTAKYRSIRSMITYRLVDTIAPPPTAIAEALSGALRGHEGSGGTEVAEKDMAPVGGSFPQNKAEPLGGHDLRDMIDTIMDKPHILSVKDVHAIICEERPEHWADPSLLNRIGASLIAMSTSGEIAAVKIYRGGDQTTASALLYCRSLELALRLMKGRTV